MPNPRPTKNERREQAREKARQEHVERLRKARRRKVITQASVIAAILAVIGIVLTVVLSNGGAAAADARPANMASDGLLLVKGGGEAGMSPVLNKALPEGAAPVPTVEDPKLANIRIYEDFMCPACKAFEDTNNSQIAAAVAAGIATVEIHPVAILDRSSMGSKYSTRAANASACIASSSPDTFWAFNQALYAAQPQEGTTGLTNDELVSIAESVNPSNADAISSCIKKGTYQGWVGQATQRIFGPDATIPGTDKLKATGTPTVVVNGKLYTGSLTDPAAFSAFMAASVAQ